MRAVEVRESINQSRPQRAVGARGQRWSMPHLYREAPGKRPETPSTNLYGVPDVIRGTLLMLESLMIGNSGQI
jgi:hypothetical protein